MPVEQYCHMVHLMLYVKRCQLCRSVQSKRCEHDGKIDASDRTFIGNPHPDLTGGINLGVNWKGFDLSTYMYFSVGNDLFAMYKYYTHYGSLQSAYSKDRRDNSWHPVTNPDGIYPMWATANGESTIAANESNSGYIEDGSFLRMQTLTLGYTLPKSILDKIKFEKIRIYGQIANVFTLTGYSGLDHRFVQIQTVVPMTVRWVPIRFLWYATPIYHGCKCDILTNIC